MMIAMKCQQCGSKKIIFYDTDIDFDGKAVDIFVCADCGEVYDIR
jgi:DNA-directed RNA polymerase subunit M/transcription elongation factor TFIIS